MSARSPAERVAALERAVELGRTRLPDADLDAASAVTEKVRGRLRHGTDHTVVALVGPTGAGKSSLFNLLCGTDLSEVGVRRPTTGTTHACVWGDGGGELLDWIGVGRRHHRDDAGEGLLEGLVLLDLPDFDSTASAHRVEVDRLVELVDLLVWVIDPQKYADEALHHGYLTPLAGHAETMRFIVNKSDTLEPGQADELVGDLRRRLVDDGIDRPMVLTVSVSNGAGIDEVRGLLRGEVERKSAAITRIEADLRITASGLITEGSADGTSKAGRAALVTSLSRAAGVDTSAALVAAQHRRDARRATTWPPSRWLRRRGREPVADLPRVGASATATAEIAGALRDIGEDASGNLSPPWPAVLRRAALSRADDVGHTLSTAITTAVGHHRDRPRWWAMVGRLQQLLTTTALVGLAWLLAVAVLGGLIRLDTDPLLIDTPGADWIPLPSALLLGGVAASFVLAAAARLPASVGARRRAGRVRRDLSTAVADVAEVEVLSHLDDVLADQREMQRLLGTVVG